MQEGFMNLSEIGLDVSFQKDDIYRRSRRLICFDMDSTLIETEVIDELAERAGVCLLYTSIKFSIFITQKICLQI